MIDFNLCKHKSSIAYKISKQSVQTIDNAKNIRHIHRSEEPYQQPRRDFGTKLELRLNIAKSES